MSMYVDTGVWGCVSMETTIATKEEQVDEAIEALMSNYNNYKRLIGLDMIPIRAAPGSSSRETSSVILSLSDESRCFIFRLHSLHTAPESLYNFLILPCFTFAGIGIKDTKEKLEKVYGLVCKNVLEVGPDVWNLLNSSSCYVVCSVFKSMKIPPTSSISHAWGCSDELKEDEIALAFSNASAAFKLGDQMVKY